MEEEDIVIFPRSSCSSGRTCEVRESLIWAGLVNTLPPFPKPDTSTERTPAAAADGAFFTVTDPCTVTILGPGTPTFGGFGAIFAKLEDMGYDVDEWSTYRL